MLRLEGPLEEGVFLGHVIITTVKKSTKYFGGKIREAKSVIKIITLLFWTNVTFLWFIFLRNKEKLEAFQRSTKAMSL